MRDWLLLLPFLGLVALAAVGGSLAAVDTAEQYDTLEKPSWAPPPWLFGPVWTVLYLAIAVSGWQIFLATRWSWDTGLWAIQLVLNALWTPLFFSWEMRGTALVWIFFLDAVVALLIVRTWRLCWPTWILLPYLAWILFATALNAAVWSLNV